MAKSSKSRKRQSTKKTSPKQNKIVKMEFGGKEKEVELYSKFDFDGFDKDTVIEWYKLNNLGRKLDEKAALYLKMAKGWSYHAPFAGHDGIQLAVGRIFRENKDYLFPYYRDMMTSLSAGLSPVEIILNGLSKDTDVAGGGRHMSNHFAKPEANVENVSSCTGNHSLHAAGVGRAIKKYEGDEIAICSTGESAVAEGYYYEAVNAACYDKSPVIFVIQNNKYGISVPLRDASANLVVSDNFKGMKNLKIIECDGRDPFDSYRALEEAKKYIESGKGPAMIHADCDRIQSHSNSDRHENYRPKDELEAVARRDPMLQFRWHLLDKKYLSEEELKEIEEDIKQQMFDAADEGEAAPDADGGSWNKYIRTEPELGPDDETQGETDEEADKISMLDGINTALKQEFRRNPHTYLWGQDIGKGGVFNVVKGMPEEFGKKRVFNSPIAEDQIVGTANGFTRYRDDIRVVIEGAEFADYFWPAMEQLIECSHEYWRTRGQFAPNITLRLASGGYIQGGLYHSQNLEAVFTSLPGLRVVQPAFADDAAGLIRNSIRSRGITLFLEPKFLYNFKQAFGPPVSEDYMVPFGQARIRRRGSDLTIVAYGTGVHQSLIAAGELEKEDIDVEIIDLRSLIPWDKESVYKSIQKTGKVVVVHEDNLTGGFGGEIAASISQESFRWLDAPVTRVGSKDCPVGFAKEYENEILINKDDVKKAVRGVYKF